MKHLILIVLLLSCFSALADDLMLGQFTYHFDDKEAERCYTYECDNSIKFHPFLGYKTEHYLFAAFENSLNEPALLAVRVFDTNLGEHLRPFAAAGLATGYDATQAGRSGVMLAMYVGLDIHPTSDEFGVVITMTPAFVGLGIRLKL